MVLHRQQEQGLALTRPSNKASATARPLPIAVRNLIAPAHPQLELSVIMLKLRD